MSFNMFLTRRRSLLPLAALRTASFIFSLDKTFSIRWLYDFMFVLSSHPRSITTNRCLLRVNFLRGERTILHIQFLFCIQIRQAAPMFQFEFEAKKLLLVNVVKVTSKPLLQQVTTLMNTYIMKMQPILQMEQKPQYVRDANLPIQESSMEVNQNIPIQI